MESGQQDLRTTQNPNSPNYSDPMIIGAGAFFLGFVLGSGRWNWFGREAGKIASSLGSLAIEYVTQSFQEHNPNLFTEKSRVTH